MSTPNWAEVPAGTTWAETPREHKLSEWLESMQPSISGWLAQLPDDFADDYSRDSLVVLERVLLERWPDARSLAETGSLFAETAARYAGLTWLRVCGGAWEWTPDDPRAIWPDQPIMRPDTLLRVPVPVFARIRDVVDDRTGTELTQTWDALEDQRRERAAGDPAWSPDASGADTFLDTLDDPAVLAAFTAARADDLARWAEISGVPAPTWDLSQTSLEALGQLVLDRGLPVEQLCRPAPDTWQWLAARYVGETFLVLGGGQWHWRPNTDQVELTPLDSDDMYIERFFIGREEPGGLHVTIPDVELGAAVHRGNALEIARGADRYREVWT